MAGLLVMPVHGQSCIAALPLQHRYTWKPSASSSQSRAQKPRNTATPVQPTSSTATAKDPPSVRTSGMSRLSPGTHESLPLLALGTQALTELKVQGAVLVMFQVSVE